MIAKDLDRGEIREGRVYWITGLSGAGKTTVGKLLYNHLLSQKDNVVRLDGDILREVFQNKDYTREGRRALGFQYSRLCNMIAKQGIDVVICTVAMFDDVRAWNRENIENYVEVYLEVSMEELIKRDQKGMYTGKESDLSGVTQEAELPKNPDLVIKNYGETKPEVALEIILGYVEE